MNGNKAMLSTYHVHKIAKPDNLVAQKGHYDNYKRQKKRNKRELH